MSDELDTEGPLFERGPVRDPRDFYGRSAETRTVLGLLSQMQNCSLTGPPNIGKTSFLLHLARRETWRAHGFDPSRYVMVYLTFEELVSRSVEEIFHTLARETISALVAEHLGGSLRVPDGPFSLDTLRQFLSGLGEGGGRVVWLLDDFGVATENPHLGPGFLRALRLLARERSLGMVIATVNLLHEVSLGDLEVGTYLADVFVPLPLGPLAPEEALAMVRDVSARAGVDLEPAWARIEALADRVPLWLRVLCAVMLRRRRGLGDNEWDETASSFYQEIEPFLILSWMRRTPAERHALIRVAQGRVRPADVPILHELQQTLLVVLEAGSWRPSCAAVRDFLVRQGPRTGEERVTSTRQALRDLQAPHPEGANATRRAVRALARAAEAHHAPAERDRTPWYAMMIAREIGCDQATVEQIGMAGRLRDVGHVATPDLIFHKPGPLTEEEWAVVRAHPVVGVQILDALRLPPEVKPAVRWHHEREDGSGYPDGLVGSEIPLAARVVGVAEAYAAMISDRAYRAAMSPQQAVEMIKEGAGTLYHEGVVAALEAIVGRNTGSAPRG